MEPAPPPCRWSSGRGVGGCYVVHSLRIFRSIFSEFFHCHFAASVSFVAISYPLSVEEDLEVFAVSFCDIFWGLEMDVAAGRAESLLSSVLNSQISLHQS